MSERCGRVIQPIDSLDAFWILPAAQTGGGIAFCFGAPNSCTSMDQACLQAVVRTPSQIESLLDSPACSVVESRRISSDLKGSGDTHTDLARIRRAVLNFLRE